MPADLAAHRDPEPRVEVRERLVHQEEPGPHDQRPREGDPLLLAARELGRHPAGEVAHLDELERVADAPGELGPATRRARSP